MSKFWNFVKNADNTGELQLYGDISESSWWGDEVTPKDFKKDLDALGDIGELKVYINSGGGDVFAGQAIHSMLKRHRASVTVYIDGLAASIASVIAMAGDKVIMPKNAMMMIHNAWTWGVGNSADFRKLADDLDKINETIKTTYLDKASNVDETKLIELMDNETWLSAEDAIKYGFADEIEESKQVAASLDMKFLNSYKNVPETLKAKKEKNDLKTNISVTLNDDFADKVAEKLKNKLQSAEPQNNEKEKLLLEIDLI